MYLRRKDIFALEVVHATDLWELLFIIAMEITLATILATFWTMVKSSGSWQMMAWSVVLHPTMVSFLDTYTCS